MANINEKYIEIIHDDPSVITLSDFVDLMGIVIDGSFNMGVLFYYEGNSERIFASYSEKDKLDNGGQPTADLLRSPTKLRVPKERFKLEYLVSSGNVVVKSDIPAFYDQKIKDIFQNVGYKPLIDYSDKTTKSFEGNAYRIMDGISVWIYSKSFGGGFDENGEIIESQGMLNVTPFVRNVVTNVGDNGGNFSIDLAPITCEFDDKKGWVVSTDAMKTFYFNGNENIVFRDSVLKFENGRYKRNLFLSQLLQENDIVFIQFEMLEMEKHARKDNVDIYGSGFLYPTDYSLAGRVFDMIGLVDVSQNKYNAETTDIDINITGRDLMKLLIEDGAYFDRFKKFDNGGKLLQRIAGSYLFNGRYKAMSIEFIINFVLNQFSNIAITRKDDVFLKYADERTQHFVFDSDEDNVVNNAKDFEIGKLDSKRGGESENKFVKKEDADGIWQIIKVAFDDEIKDRDVIDFSIGDYQGSMLNYIKKVCQSPFVEFYGDTFGDQYWFIVRKYPFTQKAFLSNFNDTGELTIYEDDIYSDDLSYSTEAYSWYRMTLAGNYTKSGFESAIFNEVTPKYFDEYAKLWGSRPFDIANIYVDLTNIGGAEEEKNAKIRELLLQDMAYCIESHAYLPFTREGTITIKRDRRIKKGMVIKNDGTNELFYVNSVSNVYSNTQGGIDGSTILTVSRGMIHGFVEGVDMFNSRMSYFNIIDLHKGSDGKSEDGDFKLNKEVFNFFVNRLQLR